MIPFADAFSGRSVFVTGHTGFKGSWLCLWLHRLGASITGYALTPPTQPSHFGAARIEEILARHHESDVRDTGALGAAMEESEPDVVVHMAAQSLVRQGFLSPQETFDVNVGGTVRVLECVRRLARACVVLVVTSDKCYENHGNPHGYVETDCMGGDDPYSASKGAAELVVASYRRSFFPTQQLRRHGVKLASVRAGNVIGGGDWAPDRIVTDVTRALRAGDAVQVRNPDAVRPWQHVLEPLSGYLTLAGRMLGSDDPLLCDAWNFGPFTDDAVTVGELVDRLIAIWGSGSWEEHRGADNQPEAQVLRLNIDKAVNKLGWRPRWALDRALHSVVEWYRTDDAHPAQGMREHSLRQIADYEATPVEPLKDGSSRPLAELIPDPLDRARSPIGRTRPS